MEKVPTTHFRVDKTFIVNLMIQFLQFWSHIFKIIHQKLPQNEDIKINKKHLEPSPSGTASKRESWIHKQLIPNDVREAPDPMSMYTKSKQNE